MSELIPEHPKGSHQGDNIADEVARGQVYLHVSVVSPERQLFTGEAHWVTLTGVDGQFGVWPQHAALVSALGSGPLRIGLPERANVEYAARSGFASIADDVVTILVDRALTSDEIDAAAVRSELEQVTAAAAEVTDQRERTRLAEQRAWCQARLKLVGE